MSFANAIILTYDDTTMVPDVMGFIIGLTPTKTPLFSSLPKTKAKGVVHAWQEESLTVAQDNAVIEGGSFGSPQHDLPTRPDNITQMFEKVYDVSSTNMWVEQYGIENQFTKQEMEAMKKIATDIELAILRGSKSSGAGSVTARRLGGFMNYITANATNVASGTKLTESFFVGLLQMVFDDGGDVDEIYTNSFLKRVISQFSFSETKNIDAKDARVHNRVEYIESDFGVQQIFIHRYMGSTTNSDSGVLCLDSTKNAIAIGEPVHVLPANEVAQDHHGKKGVIRGELTLEVRAQLHQSCAYGFDNSFN
jgi:hypothetical protein